MVQISDFGDSAVAGHHLQAIFNQHKASVDFRLIDVGRSFNTIIWRDGRVAYVTRHRLEILQLSHTWATDFRRNNVMSKAIPSGTLMAHVESERRYFTADFNAAPYLMEASLDHLKSLIETGFRQNKDGDLLMDALLHEDELGSASPSRFLKQMGLLIEIGTDQVYWSVQLDRYQTMEWARAHRPDFALLISQGVVPA